MKNIRHFIGILDLQTAMVTALALASTYFCRRFNLAADMPTGLIGVAIVFPIVFSINAAYRRREEALRYFASFKGHAVSLYYAHRDWVPDRPAQHAARARVLIQDLLGAVRQSLTVLDTEQQGRFQSVYELFSRFSTSHEELRHAGMSGNEVSRANQYLRAMMIDFERMHNIQQYRTPLSLRAYSWIFLNCFPILFGPYFAYLAGQYYLSVGFGVAVIYALVLVSLDNIQEGLENPFDEIGTDDVRLDVIEDYRPVLAE